MAAASVIGDRAIHRTLTSLAGLALASAGVLFGAMPAHAEAASPTAICEDTGSGSFATPVDIGGADALQLVTYTSTDFLSCYDASGTPLVTGTGKLTVTAPMGCTGKETPGQDGTAREDITWSDGSTTRIDGTVRAAEATEGRGDVSIDGTAQGTFAGKATTTGSISGEGCGSAEGEATSTHDMIITFS